MLKKELIFLSKFATLAYNMKGCWRFSSFIFWILPILAKCMPGWWVELWILQRHHNFLKKSLVEGCEEYDLLGGGTWTTQKEQLADAGPTAPICNHTDMGLWQRTDDVMWGASEVTQYQALFISKISPKRKVKSWNLKIEGNLEVFNQKKIVKKTRRLYFVFS
jgi:hypothetical protein